MIYKQQQQQQQQSTSESAASEATNNPSATGNNHIIINPLLSATPAAAAAAAAATTESSTPGKVSIDDILLQDQVASRELYVAELDADVTGYRFSLLGNKWQKLAQKLDGNIFF